MSDSLQPHGLHNSSWNSSGQNTGVGSRSLFQGIFPTQGLNPGLPHCKQILYQLSHQGSPGIPECVAYPCSRGSSWPRNRIGVSCIAGSFFTSWATREALYYSYFTTKNLAVLLSKLSSIDPFSPSYFWFSMGPLQNLPSDLSAFNFTLSIHSSTPS